MLTFEPLDYRTKMCATCGGPAVEVDGGVSARAHTIRDCFKVMVSRVIRLEHLVEKHGNQIRSGL